jgi:hypothetical protein
MADEKNKKLLTMEELHAKVDKIATTVLPTLHPDLQRIVDEQHPMLMDVLLTLYPDLQRIVDEQQSMSMDVLSASTPICSGSSTRSWPRQCRRCS